MVNTINEARTPGELAAWLRQWAAGADASDHLDDDDARQLAEAVERVCAPGNAAVAHVRVEEKAGAESRPFVGVDLTKGRPTYTCVEIVPGNAAALREALEKAKLYFDHRGEETNLDDAGMAIDAITSIDAALAAPARNCDVGTAEEQIKRFETFCNKSFDCGVPHGNCGACPLWTSGTMGHDCEIKWSQLPFAPAEKGGAS